jgi:hypothetical protein
MRDIRERLIEISFNSTFWMDLSAIGLRFVDEGLLERPGLVAFISTLSKCTRSWRSSPYLPSATTIWHLFRQTADAWHADNGPAIGQRSTIDLQKLLPVGA